MLNTLISIAAFVVALGLLVTVHEFGHYWVARRLGVKVLKFSVGFGRALISRRGRDGTEYALSAIPLGGYCKMLDEREGEVAEADLPRAFNRQSLGKRAAILVAGPAFNFLFAILAYWCVFMVGVPAVRPVVGAVTPDSPAAVGGIRAGDRIVAVNGSETPTWQTAAVYLLNGVMNGGTLNIKVQQPREPARTAQLRIENRKRLTRPGALLPGLGLAEYQLPAVVARVIDGGPAAAAGIQSGDKVIRSGGHVVKSWPQWVQFIRKRPGQTIPVTVLRDGTPRKLQLTIGSTSDGGQTIGHVGVQVRVPADLHDRLVTVQQYAPLPALGRAFTQTGEYSWLTLRMFWGMITGHASWKNLSGPIVIADYAGSAAEAGFGTFVTFLAVISLSLGIFNLFPIPVLDGGHLLYYAIEWIKGGPLSSRTEMIGQQVGLTLLLLVFGFVIFNDLTRLAVG